MFLSSSLVFYHFQDRRPSFRVAFMGKRLFLISPIRSLELARVHYADFPLLNDRPSRRMLASRGIIPKTTGDEVQRSQKNADEYNVHSPEILVAEGALWLTRRT
jgi:hypothetical protein